MTAKDCPHCQTTNQDAGAFCVACGMAMPRPTDKPRVVEAGELAAIAFGRELQLDMFRAQVRGGRLILIIFAVLPIALCFLTLLLSLAIDNDYAQKQTIASGGVFLIIGLLTLALWFWAGRRPFPATLVGLILYASAVFAVFPNLFSEDATEMVFSGLAVLVCGSAAALLAVPVARGLRYRTVLRLTADREAARE